MFKKLKLFFIFFLVATSGLSAAAQPASPPAKESPAQHAPSAPPMEPSVEETPSPPTYEGAFFKMILSLIGLLALIFLTFWLFRRFSQGRLQGMSLARSIKIIERRPLSAKTMLYLIEIDKKKMVVAESQLEVRTLYAEDKNLEPIE